MPTGLAGLPPVGPATPVTATVMLAAERASAPTAIARAVASLTAPWATSVASGTPSMSCFAAFE